MDRKMKYARLFMTAVSGIMLFFNASAATAESGTQGSGDNPRKVTLLDKGWKFHKGEKGEWEEVTVPHDWAIYGPFDRSNDLQTLAVEQNLEDKASVKTGRTGGLPYMGTGWYLLNFDVDLSGAATRGGRKAILLFDGAMSEARVYVNGHEVIYWPYGYNSFYCDITGHLTEDGKGNELKVRLENKPLSSRWYPGAGLYRNVYLIETNAARIPVWGTAATAEYNAAGDSAEVRIVTEIEGIEEGFSPVLKTFITGPDGKKVAENIFFETLEPDSAGHMKVVQTFSICRPELWSPETPNLYKAESRLYVRAKGSELRRGAPAREILSDIYITTFGIRTIEVRPETGFYLNGENVKFKGVCLHHDLGPLGAAVNKSALRHQLEMLKDMGCNAIRTTHNMPAPELVELCDEMGFMVVLESFDEWNDAKCFNGYHRFFNEWAEKDMVNMIRHFRNSPSVVMWSIGNEVPSQSSPEGYRTAAFLQDICHREDPTRPVTCGMDHIDAVLSNGFAAVLDVPGFNYRPFRYEDGYNILPQKVLLGSETSSTVSSRGVYHFPVEEKAGALHEDHQSSSYDVEFCGWSNIPEEDFAMADDYPWTMGQFVWTGFDYLGEPTPYDTDSWPNHSSMFGIIDLASIPKDRYWLYRSVWNEDSPTLHILPHWNWEGREGECTPVYVYTSYPKAELFLNGKSMGIREKNDSTLMSRYRLMWNDVKYEPGELVAVAYDNDGKKVAEKSIRTAGKPYAIELVPSRDSLVADGKDLLYVTVRIVDRDGNLCPLDNRKVRFDIEGEGSFRAVANGDPTCLELFHIPEMSAFGGQLTVIVQSSLRPGLTTVKATAKGLKKAILTTKVCGSSSY